MDGSVTQSKVESPREREGRRETWQREISSTLKSGKRKKRGEARKVGHARLASSSLYTVFGRKHMETSPPN